MVKSYMENLKKIMLMDIADLWRLMGKQLKDFGKQTSLINKLMMIIDFKLRI